jgi:hypothetical protein
MFCACCFDSKPGRTTSVKKLLAPNFNFRCFQISPLFTNTISYKCQILISSVLFHCEYMDTSYPVYIFLVSSKLYAKKDTLYFTPIMEVAECLCFSLIVLDACMHIF